jgi:histidyl-tRNA synthetase
MDIIGEESVLADADLLSAALEVLRVLGLTSDDVVARVSDRRLLHAALVELGVKEDDLAVAYNVIDKVERDPREVCVRRLAELGLTQQQAEKALGLTDMTLAQFAAAHPGNELINSVSEDVNRYFEALRALGFGDWVVFDMKIVRGLAYYTGIVFEIFDRKGELRAICGGGRYDGLFLSLCGIDVSALGFGFGDVVLGELLKDRKLAADTRRGVDAMVVAIDDSVRDLALRVVAQLRGAGLSVVYPYKASGVGKALKAATAAGAKDAILIGPEEASSGKLTVKNLGDGTERVATVEEYLKARGARGGERARDRA